MPVNLSKRILPKDLNAYIKEKLSNDTNIDISVLSDYGYYDENGFVDVNGPDDGDFIDYRVFKIVEATCVIQKEKNKTIYRIKSTEYTISPEPEEAYYTVLQSYVNNLLSLESEEEALEILINILKPYYVNWTSSDPIPVRSVLTDIDTMKEILTTKYKISDKEAKELIREFVELLISSATSKLELYVDDGEESRWESETDKANRIELVYTLLYKQPPSETIVGSVTSVINSIRLKY